MINDIVLGIDFGCSNSGVSYYDPVKKELITLSSENKTLKSVLTLHKQTQKISVGVDPDQNDEDHIVIYNLKGKLNQGTIHNLPVTILVSQVISHIKVTAEKVIGQQITKAVLTVPAYFTENLRKILRDSSRIAGINVLRILSEPTAAAYYYASTRMVDETCLVVDVGGLTVDFTLCNVVGNVIDVISIHGDSSGGHNIINEQIIKDILEKYPTQTKGTQDPQVVAMAEMVKKDLYDQGRLTHQITYHGKGKESIKLSLTVNEKGKYYDQFLSRIKETYATLLKKAKVKEGDIDRLILLGGPCQSQYFLKSMLSMIRIPSVSYFDHFNAVSKGAALYGINLSDHKPILSDVIGLSVGVELENGIFEKILESGNKIPCFKIKQFTTTQDFQAYVDLKVLQGERPLANECNLLGQITLDNIPLKQKGTPLIKIMMQMDENGILNVYAMEDESKKLSSIEISSQNRLGQPEILKMVEEFKKHQVLDEDHIQRLKIIKELNQLSLKLKAMTKPGQQQSNLHYLFEQRLLHTQKMSLPQLISLSEQMKERHKLILSQAKEGNLSVR